MYSKIMSSQSKKKVEEIDRQSSISIIFLNSLKPAWAIQLYDEMIKKKKFVPYINLAHIQLTLATIDVTSYYTLDMSFFPFFSFLFSF
jgi:hypothetical protein